MIRNQNNELMNKDKKEDKDLNLIQLFENSIEITEIPKVVDMYLKNAPSKKISGFLLTSNLDLLNAIDNEKTFHYKIIKKSKNKESASFVISKSLKRSKRLISGNVLLIKTAHKNVFIALSDGTSEFIKFGVEKYFKDTYPNTAVVGLSSKNIYDSLSRLSKKLSVEIVADRTVATKQILKNKKESEVTYTSISFEDAFKRASEDDRWIDKIEFSAFDKSQNRKRIMNAFISRDSLFKVNKNFSLFYEFIVSYLADAAQKTYSFYSDRGRKQENGIREPKPLTIDFGQTVFDKPEKNKYLVEAIKQLNGISISVIHGNPYLHASILDLLDGSSYDLWVLSQTRLILVPQLRATTYSLNRVCDHITTKFREGEIKNFQVDDYAKSE